MEVELRGFKTKRQEAKVEKACGLSEIGKGTVEDWNDASEHTALTNGGIVMRERADFTKADFTSKGNTSIAYESFLYPCSKG